MPGWIWIKIDGDITAYINTESIDGIFVYENLSGIKGTQLVLRSGEKVFSPLDITETYNSVKNRTNISGPLRKE
jgi:hypothetical protein